MELAVAVIAAVSALIVATIALVGRMTAITSGNSTWEFAARGDDGRMFP